MDMTNFIEKEEQKNYAAQGIFSRHNYYKNHNFEIRWSNLGTCVCMSECVCGSNCHDIRFLLQGYHGQSNL